MNIESGLQVTAAAGVTYGALRLCVAKWADKDPAAVTVDDIRAYEAERKGSPS